jgi:hypothetical protein
LQSGRCQQLRRRRPSRHLLKLLLLLQLLPPPLLLLLLPSCSSGQAHSTAPTRQAPPAYRVVAVRRVTNQQACDQA